jgi:hypothetical protein
MISNPNRPRGFPAKGLAFPGLAAAVALWLGVAGISVGGGNSPGADQKPRPSGAPATQAASKPAQDVLPFIHVDAKAGYVDIDASVVMREGDWLELAVCIPQSKEHESILVTHAKPSHIHAALLMLGLEPGEPLRREEQPGKVLVYGPYGPRVAVTVVYADDKGQTVERPISDWIYDRQTKTNMPNEPFIFTGSFFAKTRDGGEIYMADPVGTVLSLVTFGDEVLGRPTEVTNMNDQQIYGCKTELIPKLKTPVTVRLKPLEKTPPKRPAPHTVLVGPQTQPE